MTPILTYNVKQQFQLDFIDLKKSTHANLGNRYVLTVIDHFSKYVFCFPLKTRDSDIAAQKMRELFEQGHVPKVLHCDNEFGNLALAKVCADYDVLVLRGPPFQPRSQGGIERFNRTIKTAIRQVQVFYDDLTFIDALDKMVESYNNTIHSSHKFTPRQVYYGNEETKNQALENATEYRQRRYSEVLHKILT